MANSLSRTEKLENISGEKYPRDFPGRETISSVLFQYNNNIHLKENLLPKLNLSKPIYKIAGRISAKRNHRDNIFLDIFDQTGGIQLHAKLICEDCDGTGTHTFIPAVGDEAGNQTEACPTCCGNKITWPAIEECDIGDMVGVEGQLEQNLRGEALLLISDFTLLAKALKDPPANFHGVKNPEHKYRHREQDLLSSAETREVFKTRARIVFEIRKYLNKRDFIEIECPVLQPIYGGATARPFKTFHNALSQDFFLSISSELYLKRAMVGGFDRVYAFSRCFRNEGISPEHNPEFTNLEIFETCKTDLDMIKFTEDLLEHAAHSVGSLVPPMIFDADLPAQDWPLSRKAIGKGRHKDRAEAWELYIDGMEVASGASDLNDPRKQEELLRESEAQSFRPSEDIYGEKILAPIKDYDPYDPNYIEALECGLLPIAGVGIGIDRLIMLLTGHTNIRDVILFPTLKSLAT